MEEKEERSKSFVSNEVTPRKGLFGRIQSTRILSRIAEDRKKHSNDQSEKASIKVEKESRPSSRPESIHNINSSKTELNQFRYDSQIFREVDNIVIKFKSDAEAIETKIEDTDAEKADERKSVASAPKVKRCSTSLLKPVRISEPNMVVCEIDISPELVVLSRKKSLFCSPSKKDEGGKNGKDENTMISKSNGASSLNVDGNEDQSYKKFSWLKYFKNSLSGPKTDQQNKLLHPTINDERKVKETISFIEYEYEYESELNESSSTTTLLKKTPKLPPVSKVYEKSMKLCEMYSKDNRVKKVQKYSIILKINQLMWADLTCKDDAYMAIMAKLDSPLSEFSHIEMSELLNICMELCPPTLSFLLKIEKYYEKKKNLNEDTTPNQSLMTTLDHIAKMKASIAPKGTQNPTLDSITQIRDSIYNYSMFNISILELMSNQSHKFASLPVPWILYVLCNEVISRGGLESEGIFRVPGDIDVILQIKYRLNKYGTLASNCSSYDCASVLKQWCRELPIPLIPDFLYQDCIKNSLNTLEILEIVKPISETIMKSICFIIKFLRMFLKDGVVDKTKMTIDNLSMVWSPSFLRSPYTDPNDVVSTVGKEISVTKILITELDVSSIDSLKLDGHIDI